MPTGTATTSPARSELAGQAAGAGGADMRMLPLLVVFALLAAGIGYALAEPARHVVHDAPTPRAS